MEKSIYTIVAYSSLKKRKFHKINYFVAIAKLLIDRVVSYKVDVDLSRESTLIDSEVYLL